MKHSVNLIRELINYIWPTDKAGKPINRPVDVFNHVIDAGKYIILDYLIKYFKNAFKIKHNPEELVFFKNSKIDGKYRY